jgi:hypothetical protein
MSTDPWPTFTGSLAGDLLRLREDDAVILSVVDAVYVQVIKCESALRMEVRPRPGSGEAVRALGWSTPAPGDGDNWSTEVAMPDDRDRYRAAARLLVTTLRDVLGVADPASLRVKAFSVVGAGTVRCTAMELADRDPDPDALNPGLAEARAEIAAADERRYAELELIAAGITRLIAELCPTGRLVAVTGTSRGRGSFPSQDRIVYVPPPVDEIVVFGAGADLGRRRSADWPPSDGPYTWADQGTFRYLRHMLDADPYVLAGLADDPQAADAVRRFLAGHTSAPEVTHLWVDVYSADDISHYELDLL